MKKQFKTGRDVDEWLALQDLTRKELAVEIGYSYSRVSHICAATDKPLPPKFALAVESYKKKLMECSDYRYSNDNFLQQIYDVLEVREIEMTSLKEAIVDAKLIVERLFNVPIDLENKKLSNLNEYYMYLSKVLEEVCHLVEGFNYRNYGEEDMEDIVNNILEYSIEYSKKR